MEWNGMERKFWYGIWKMPEWNGMEDFKNGRQSSILPYQFHTRFCAFFTEKYIPMSGGDKKYCHRNIQLQYLRVLFVDKLRYLGRLYCENSVLIAVCSIDVIVDDFDRFDFFFEIDYLPCPKFCVFTSSRKLIAYLLFHFRFSLILFKFLVFQLTKILFGVKAWYFFYGKCSLAIWL